MANIGQTILIRTDLFGDNIGLLAAQIAHIHAKPFYAERPVAGTTSTEDVELLDLQEFAAWKKNPYVYIKKVPNAETLSHFIDAARAADVPCQTWRDTVYVKVSAKQNIALPDVLVGAAFGPTDSDKIKTVIGDLPLL